MMEINSNSRETNYKNVGVSSELCVDTLETRHLTPRTSHFEQLTLADLFDFLTSTTAVCGT